LIARALSYFARSLDYPERECYQASARVATHAIFAARDPAASLPFTMIQYSTSPGQVN